MPVVLLKYREGKIPLESFSILINNLPRIIAEALDIPENPNARLTANDIEIWSQPSHPCDKNTKDLSVIVLVHDYPERVKNLDERNEYIAHYLRQFMETQKLNLTGWSWIHPGHTAFKKVQS